ncbi:MAG: hypothetical protein WCX29_03015 [Candidatus Peribacteraceae bacterium]|nr:hypothetical protein [Candidatus Peribacteria bacterium]
MKQILLALGTFGTLALFALAYAPAASACSGYGCGNTYYGESYRTPYYGDNTYNCHYYGSNGACYHYSYRDYRPYYPTYNYHRDNISYHPYEVRSRTPERCTYQQYDRYGRYQRYTRNCTEQWYYR